MEPDSTLKRNPESHESEIEEPRDSESVNNLGAGCLTLTGTQVSFKVYSLVTRTEP